MCFICVHFNCVYSCRVFGHPNIKLNKTCVAFLIAFCFFCNKKLFILQTPFPCRVDIFGYAYEFILSHLFTLQTLFPSSLGGIQTWTSTLSISPHSSDPSHCLTNCLHLFLVRLDYTHCCLLSHLYLLQTVCLCYHFVVFFCVTASTRSPYSRIAHPDRHNGDPAYCEGFLLQSSLYFTHQMSVTDTEKEFISFNC